MFKSTVKALVATALLSVTATAASAEDHIFLDSAQNINTEVNLRLVRSDKEGVLSVYDFHKGERGELLGSVVVHQGATHNLDIPLFKKPANDIVVVLTHEGSATPVMSEEVDND